MTLTETQTAWNMARKVSKRVSKSLLLIGAPWPGAQSSSAHLFTIPLILLMHALCFLFKIFFFFDIQFSEYRQWEANCIKGEQDRDRNKGSILQSSEQTGDSVWLECQIMSNCHPRWETQWVLCLKEWSSGDSKENEGPRKNIAIPMPVFLQPFPNCRWKGPGKCHSCWWVRASHGAQHLLGLWFPPHTPKGEELSK